LKPSGPARTHDRSPDGGIDDQDPPSMAFAVKAIAIPA
jgi:hypothetical protein